MKSKLSRAEFTMLRIKEDEKVASELVGAVLIVGWITQSRIRAGEGECRID